jgi:hypothetical protein
VPAERSADDLRPPHPLTPNTTVVTVTKALQYVLANNAKGLETVTLVPVALTPRPEDSKITPDLFRFDEVVLRTYLSGTETQLDAATN